MGGDEETDNNDRVDSMNELAGEFPGGGSSAAAIATPMPVGEGELPFILYVRGRGLRLLTAC